MRRSVLLLALALLVTIAPTGLPPANAAPPAGDISSNVEFIGNVPLPSAIAINFIGDVMLVSTAHGLYSFDVSDPTSPTALGALPMYIWENEDMDVDPVRKLAFISRDPRGFTSPAAPGAAFPYGAVHVIDVSDPSALRQINMFLVPAGHTTTCVNACRYLWTAGPYANAQTQPDFVGRPIYATDLRDPVNPKPCPEPLDTERNDGVTDYVHDVQVDAQGVAWVSGAGGVRGYWTSGRHLNPLTGEVQRATGCRPIPYAGGGTPDSATPSRFMHNAWRNVRASIPGAKGTRGMVLYGTEENTVTDCKASGRFATYDLRGSLRGQGWKDIDETKFRLRALDTWTPEDQPGSTGCDSAHYFTDRGDGVLAYAFYSQGTRFIDASNPRDIRQIGYYRPDDANTWAAYWHGGYVFVADFTRGVDILRFRGGTESAPVRAPAGAGAKPLPKDAALAYLCPRPFEGAA